MSSKTAHLERGPVIRIGKSSSELVWPNGARRGFHNPEIELAQKELNRVMSLSKLDSTASIDQQQNRADSIFEARIQLGHAVRDFVRLCGADLKAPTA
tara:strand:- start:1475 stop:1768 length:294 start_codon:yes stop_codon:yes gene_type:complete